MPRRPTVSFVVPALNEERNIRSTVSEVHEAGKVCEDYEILLVDDASKDATGAIMDELAAADPRIRAFHNTANLGVGGSYKRGIELARHEYLMWVAGDNDMPAHTLVQVLSRVGEADMVIPYLKNDTRPFFRQAISRAFNGALNLLFQEKVRYHNGPVVHRVEALRSISIGTDGPGYQAEAIVKLLAKGYTYVEEGYESVERKGAVSSIFKPKSVVAVLEMLRRTAGETKRR